MTKVEPLDREFIAQGLARSRGLFTSDIPRDARILSITDKLNEIIKYINHKEIGNSD